MRTGDEVEVMRGSMKGFKGIVERVDLKNLKRDSQPIPAIPRASAAKTQHNWFMAGMGVVAVIAVVTAFFVWRASARGPIDSLAVIPFENESGNEEVEYLSDGISESLINALSRIPDLKVISRRSAFEFKGSDEEVAEIGRKLGVRAVLVGRMTQRGRWFTRQPIRILGATHRFMG